MKTRWLLILVLAIAARAQGIHGVVQDPTGAPVEGADVTAYNHIGNAVEAVRTDTTGRFRLAAAASFIAIRPPRFQTSEFPAPGSLFVLHPHPLRTSIPVTATRGLAADAAASAQITSIRTAEDLSARPLPTIGSALESVPGIFMQQSTTAQTSPFLRGLTGYQVLNLIDGVRFNNSSFRSGPNQYLAFVEPSQVERMETILGPAGASYGSDALGGAIQVISPDVPSAPGPHGSAPLFGSSADLSTGSSAGLAWNSLLLGAFGRRHGNMRPGGGFDSRNVFYRFFGLQNFQEGRLPETAFGQYGAHAKALLRFANNQSLTAWYQHSAQDGVRGYKDLLGGLGRMQSSFDPQRLNFGYVRYEKQRVAFLDTLSGTASINSQIDGSVRQGLSSTGTITTDRNRIDVWGFSGQGTTHIGRDHVVVFGAESYGEHAASTRFDRNPVTNGITLSRPLYPDGAAYRTNAGFAQAISEIGRFRATAGVRLTSVGFDTTAGNFGVIDSNQTFRDVSFQSSITWNATSGLGVFGIVSKGFRAPNLNDLGALGLNDLGFEIPSADAIPSGALLATSAGEDAVSTGRPLRSLNAERLFNYEAGIRLRTTHRYLRVQVFDTELYDPIVRRTLLFPANAVPASLGNLAVTPIAQTAAQRQQGVVTVATAIDPRAVKAFVNDGRSRYTGVEALAEFAFGPWQWRSGYSFLAGRDLNPNRNIRRLPPQQGFAALHRRGRRWWGELRLTATGSQERLSGGDRDDERIGASRSRNDIASFFNGSRVAPYRVNGVFTPTGETLEQIQNRILPGVAAATRVPLYNNTAQWFRTDFSTGYSLTEMLSLNAGIWNLFDRNYRYHGSGVDGAGIDAFLSVFWRF